MLAESVWKDPVAEEPDKDYLHGGFNWDAISYRTYDAKMYIDDNPFSDHCFTRTNLVLLNKTDTDLVIKQVFETSGVVYADRFRVYAKWDIYSPDPRSQQVILRQSYGINWLSKPFGVWRVIDPLASSKFEKTLDREPTWYRNSKEQYLAGLESGIYELPLDEPYWEEEQDEDSIDGGF